MHQYLELMLAMTSFVGSHFLLSWPPLRLWLVERLGMGVFIALYSLIALITLVWAMRAYGSAPDLALWHLGPLGRWMPQSIMPLACILVVCGLLARSPTAVGGERLIREGAQPQGIFTVTRHPFLWGTGLWALSHLAANGDFASALLFGGMLVLSFGGMLAIDHKRAVALGRDWQTLRTQTSLLPFAAALQGRISLDWRGIGWWRPLLGLVLYVALMHGHLALFGVPATG